MHWNSIILPPHLDEGEWKQFLCVEASNIIGAAVALAPGFNKMKAAQRYLLDTLNRIRS